MKRKSQVALTAAALAAAVLVVGAGLFGGPAPPPAQATVAEAPGPAWPRPSAAPAAETLLDDGALSATGMEHVPVFD